MNEVETPLSVRMETFEDDFDFQRFILERIHFSLSNAVDAKTMYLSFHLLITFGSIPLTLFALNLFGRPVEMNGTNVLLLAILFICAAIASWKMYRMFYKKALDTICLESFRVIDKEDRERLIASLLRKSDDDQRNKTLNLIRVVVKNLSEYEYAEMSGRS